MYPKMDKWKIKTMMMMMMMIYCVQQKRVNYKVLEIKIVTLGMKYRDTVNVHKLGNDCMSIENNDL